MSGFRLGISRDVLDARGEPSFGRRALDVLAQEPAIEWEYIAEDLTEVTPEVAARYDGLYINGPKVTRASVGRGDRRVRIVARHGVGFDSVDVDALTERGIVLTNTPDAVRRPMAVVALTFVFVLAGRLFVKDRLVRENRWSERTMHMGIGLTTRTLGVVGVGGIGRELLGLARPFFGRMVAADPYADADAVRALGAEVLALDGLLSESDFVVVCCPLNPDTFHLMNADRLRRMRPSAHLINIARGPVVDEAALVAALRAGTIAGAGLDVFEQEPTRPDNPLARMDDVVLTPHALGWTDECFHDIAATAFRGVVAFCRGERPGFVVNPAALDRAPGPAR